MATTLVISDLHLGGRGGTDVLRKPEVRATLLAALRGVDRLVLLGDVLERRARAHVPRLLGLEQCVSPARASWAAAQMAAWLGDASTTVAYPGLWLRDDVYATHGHLLDLFSTIPTFERIGAAITTRVVGGEVPEEATLDDFL